MHFFANGFGAKDVTSLKNIILRKKPIETWRDLETIDEFNMFFFHFELHNWCFFHEISSDFFILVLHLTCISAMVLAI